MNPNDYNYETAGFDGFLSRSIDSLAQVTLASPGPQTTALRYDSSQLSGFVGNTIQIGGVRITPQGILMNDGSNDVLLIGDENG